jgi:hypothetical protein
MILNLKFDYQKKLGEKTEGEINFIVTEFLLWVENIRMMSFSPASWNDSLHKFNAL